MPDTNIYTPGTCTTCKCQINLEVEGPVCDECVNTEIGEAQEILSGRFHLPHRFALPQSRRL